MVTLESLSKLHTSVVYLARDPINMLSVDIEELGQILGQLEVRSEGGSAVISSMAAQIQVKVTPRQIQVHDRSDQQPCKEDFPERAVGVAGYFAKINDSIYRDVGVNFDLSFTRDLDELPSQFILKRAIRDDVFDSIGHVPKGASVRFWYDARGMAHHLYVEPRGNSFEGADFYAHINVNYRAEGDSPTVEWLRETIQTEYQDFINVLRSVLDG